MSMTLQEAETLQEHIGSIYPSLDVVVRQIGKPDGDEFCCFIVRRKYYLWSMQDWTSYSQVHFSGLHNYTEDARIEQSKKMRTTRAKTKQKRVRVPA